MDSVWNFTFGATGTLKDEVNAENTQHNLNDRFRLMMLYDSNPWSSDGHIISLNIS